MPGTMFAQFRSDHMPARARCAAAGSKSVMNKKFCSLAFGTFFFVASALATVGSCSAEDETVGGGLTAHWTFQEGAGDVVKDSSGQGNDGAIVPANTTQPKWGTGGFAGSVSF